MNLGRIHALFLPVTPSVALLGPDGSGKSTLAAYLQQHAPLPVHVQYMGLYGKRSPLPRWANRPGLSLLYRIGRQWHRYARARWQQAGGKLIIYDRYAFDAWLPALSNLTPSQRVRRWLLGRCCPHPQLVIVLDAPVELLFQRKPEHPPAALARQREGYQRLQQQLPGSLLLDTNAPVKVVGERLLALLDAYILPNHA